jgi:hypothetical protein
MSKERKSWLYNLLERGKPTDFGRYFSTHGTALSAASMGLEVLGFFEDEAAAARALLLKKSAIVNVVR